MKAKQQIESELLYNLYVDKHGCLRMVMEIFENNIVRGIDVSNMNICGLWITDDLKIAFHGHGGFDSKRHKVIWQ